MMAVDALPAGALVARTGVALRTRHGHVQSHERKAAQVVVERHVFPPAFGRMALLAMHAEFAAVNVLGAMTFAASDR